MLFFLSSFWGFLSLLSLSLSLSLCLWYRFMLWSGRYPVFVCGPGCMSFILIWFCLVDTCSQIKRRECVYVWIVYCDHWCAYLIWYSVQMSIFFLTQTLSQTRPGVPGLADWFSALKFAHFGSHRCRECPFGLAVSSASQVWLEGGREDK